MTIQLHRADFAASKALAARLKGWFEYHDNDNSNDTSDTVLIENNGVTPESDCNPFSNKSIVFN